MNKENMYNFLNNSFKIKNEIMRQLIIDELLEPFINTDLDPNLLEFAEREDWEQLRVIKQRMDNMWKKLKAFSEQVLVKVKVQSMIDSFPKPKDLKPRNK